MTRLMKDMNEPELKAYFNALMDLIKTVTPPDVTGFILVQCTDQGIAQYASSLKREGAIDALRECADRLERRDTVER